MLKKHFLLFFYSYIFFAVQEQNACEITQFNVEVGNCQSNTTYKLWVNFKVVNSPTDKFDLWGNNGQHLGTFTTSQLPIFFPNYQTSGGSHDRIKVCMQTNTPCCAVKEFPVPECLNNGGGNNCSITNFVVETGDCQSDSTYKLWLNFKVLNPPSDQFDVWTGNGKHLGSFSTSQLPLHFPNFLTNGGTTDKLKVCMKANSPVSTPCCATTEFKVPDCKNSGGGNCSIVGLVVETGDCQSNTTYKLWLNFKVINPTSNKFDVWTSSGQHLGTFSTGQLPLHFPNFPTNGSSTTDKLKVCMRTTTNVPCCAIAEFKVPECGGSNQNCEISDLSVKTGACNNKSGYRLMLNFKVKNPPSDKFVVWASNGQSLGTYSLSQLPLIINDFPSSGAKNDRVKVCMVSTSAASACCASIEFLAPDCSEKECKISDLNVTATPCLCGKFFAVLTFNHKNGGTDGFDVFNLDGELLGNYPYSTPQPLILGAFEGDGSTFYGFILRDHQNPNKCFAGYKLGQVNCPPQIQHPGTPNLSKLSISPNPASQNVNISVQNEGGQAIGDVRVQVLDVVGRVVLQQNFAEGNQFTLNIGELPPGNFRVQVSSKWGVSEGFFVKIRE